MIEQDAYTLVDFMLGFQPTDDIDARLNLNIASTGSIPTPQLIGHSAQQCGKSADRGKNHKKSAVG